MHKHSFTEIRRKGVQREYCLYFTIVSNGPGVFFAWIANLAGISPNVLTIVGALLCLPAVLLNLTGHIYWALAVFHLFFVFDCADGILARATDQKSALGAYLDDISHEIFHPFFIISLALHLQLNQNSAGGFVCMAAAVANSLFRANHNLLEKRSVSARVVREGEITWVERLRYSVAGTFNYPNILVWMTATAWNLHAELVYLGYTSVMACIYVVLCAVRIIINARKDRGRGSVDVG